MKDRINLGLLQIQTGPKKEQNLKKLDNLLKNLENDLDIVVTPEYLMGLEKGELSKEILEKNAEQLEENFVKKFCKKARELETSILFTMYRKDKDGFYNTSVFVDDNGKIKGKYDKTHLFDAFDHKESNFFKHGQKIIVFDWKKHKIGLATCFDLRFPELFRVMKWKGADLILIPSGFYTGPNKLEQWRTLLSARAHENNFFVVGVNQPEPYFVGESLVSSPLGYTVDSLGTKEGAKMVQINMKEIEKAEKKIPIQSLLRTDFYLKYDPYKKS